MFTNLEGPDARKIAKMCAWFTSPDYKALASRRKPSGGPDIVFPP